MLGEAAGKEGFLGVENPIDDGRTRFHRIRALKPRLVAAHAMLQQPLTTRYWAAYQVFLIFGLHVH
jgi:hypothetical protein